MAYLPELHHCCVCGDYLGPDNGDGICPDCDDGTCVDCGRIVCECAEIEDSAGEGAPDA